MESTSHGDIRINGSGSAGGGTYENVIIRGTGKVTGDLICTVFQVSGTGTVEGSLETSEGKINGSGTVEGDVKGKKFKISGTGRIDGNAHIDEFGISGSGSVGKSVEAQRVRIEGSAKIGIGCSCEDFEANGGFEIGGLLNADEVRIRLHSMKSKVREIGGGKITVALGPVRGFVRSIVSMGLLNPVLETDTIEGDEITLENTTARIIRGNRVTIGSGCDIGTVEYKESYTKDTEAHVGTATKM